MKSLFVFGSGVRSLSLMLFLCLTALTVAAAEHQFNVLDFGATGDGATLDTASINRAIEACSGAGGGEVLIPAGRYLSGTVRLRSHLSLVLGPGARLVGTTNLTEYQQPIPPAFMPEAKWGKWHRGLIIGEDLEDVTISGPGTIDGNKVFDPTGEEHMRGPHGIIFVNCRGFTLRDVTIVDAANYAVYFEVSDDVDVRNVRIIGGWDGVHWRGAPERWCKHVNIIGCEFYTGDDSIAGRYWDQTVIANCVINSSCNGLRLIGPATHLKINNCLFYGPGLQPHRTSGEKRRTNMLSGINLQPGAWDATRGPLDDVLISRVTMDQVASPVTLWSRPGNTVGRVVIDDLHATGIYRAAFAVESWAETPMTNVVIRDAWLEYTGGGSTSLAAQAVAGPGVDARPLPAWGFYLRNVQQLRLENVQLSLQQEDGRPAVLADRVQELRLRNFSVPRVTGASEAIVTTNGAHVVWEHALPGMPSEAGR
jgi:hypothetical protein